MTERDKPAHTMSALTQLTHEIERNLFDRYGPLIADDTLRIALGYKSMEAFRQAIARGTLGVPVFSIPNRRGKYALVKDVAAWLATLRNGAIQESGTDPETE